MVSLTRIEPRSLTVDSSLMLSRDATKVRVGDFSYRGVARLKPGVTLEQANATDHNMGRLADALDPLTAAVGLEPQNAVAHLNLGITLPEPQPGAGNSLDTA